MKTLLLSAILFVSNVPSLEPAHGTLALNVAKGRIHELEKGVYECASGRPIKIYFNQYDWVEVSCKVVKSNLWKTSPKHMQQSLITLPHSQEK